MVSIETIRDTTAGTATLETKYKTVSSVKASKEVMALAVGLKVNIFLPSLKCPMWSIYPYWHKSSKYGCSSKRPKLNLERIVIAFTFLPDLWHLTMYLRTLITD